MARNYVSRPPEITSNSVVRADENISKDQVVYTAQVRPVDDETFTYSISGADASYVNIDESNGELRFKVSPNFELKEVYNFVLSVSDGSLSSQKDITINIDDINEAPSISSSSFSTLQVGSSLDTVIYDGEASDPDSDTLTYSVSGDDASLVRIDPDDGEVRLISEGDFTTKAYI